MILIKNEKARYVEYICQGTVESLKKNEPLSRMLGSIEKNEIPEGVSRFLPALKSRYAELGYIDGDNITPLGREIIETGCEWQSLYGTHRLGIIESEGQRYVVSHECDYKGGFKPGDCSSPKLSGEFSVEGGISLRGINLEKRAKMTEAQEVTVECRYDFERRSDEYSVTLPKGAVCRFRGNEGFSMLKKGEAEELLREELEDYLALSYIDGRVVLNGFFEDNRLVMGALDEIFDKGSYTHRGQSGVTVEDITLSVEDSEAAEDALIRYLSREAERAYLGRSEIDRLTNRFYSFFDSCITVSLGASEITERLFERTSRSNRAAYLRLLAYRHLAPDSHGGYNRPTVTLDGKQKNMKEMAKAIIGSREGVTEVRTFSQFAKNNAAISKAYLLFSEALRGEYGARLKLYTSDEQLKNNSYTQINQRKYKELDESENIEHKMLPRESFKDIHDRYFLIVCGEKKHWVKTTAELDSLRYDTSYGRYLERDDITVSKRGEVMNYSVISLEDRDVVPAVKMILEVAE